jgi:hypothetical protein
MAGLPEHRRGVLDLNHEDAALEIDGNMAVHAPTPFPFRVSIGASNQLKMFAENQQEFRAWTNAISAVINKKRSLGGRRSSKTPRLQLSQPDSASGLEQAHKSDTFKNALSDAKAFLAILSAREFFAINAVIIMCMWSSHRIFTTILLLVNSAFIAWMQMERPSLPNQIEAKGQRSQKIGGKEMIGGEDRGAKKTTPKASKRRLSAAKKSADRKALVTPPQPKRTMALTTLSSGSGSGASHCWADLGAGRFKVRKGPNYKKTKIKAPSADAIFEVIGVDHFETERKVDHIAARLVLPDPGQGRRLFVVNAQCPKYPPANPLWGKAQTDGEGWSIVIYFAMPNPSTADGAGGGDASTKLWEEFMSSTKGNRLHDRFKALAFIDNTADVSFGKMERQLVEGWNGQPLLTRPQHRFYDGTQARSTASTEKPASSPPAGSSAPAAAAAPTSIKYFEVDVDVHEFGFFANRGFHGLLPRFKQMVLDVGFVVEGHGDHELPERILGCVQLIKLDLTKPTKRL